MQTVLDGNARNPLRILLVDDHAMLLEALTHALDDETDIEIVGHARSSAEAMTAFERLTPDVVVLDQRLPDGDGTRTARQMHALRPDARIVMLTATDDRRLRTNATAAGCVGYVTKDQPISVLIAIIRGSVEGAAQVESHEGQGADTGLTLREFQVLELAAVGLDNAAIASELFMSVNTVRNHFQGVLTKLDAHSKLEAVAIGLRLGLVAVPQ